MAASVVVVPDNRNSGGSRKPKRGVIKSGSEEENTTSFVYYNMDTDISQLEAPTFTTLDKEPSRSMVQLKWDHEVNLIGKKVVNPMIHCCDKCLKPILIYGRTIPCKHVFCLKCAMAEEKKDCSRCGEKFSRVEQAGLGSIFMCSHGGSRYGNDGCRRTYLSQRDLHAHIQHRHFKTTDTNGSSSAAATTTAMARSSLPDERLLRIRDEYNKHHYSPRSSFNYHQQPISVISSNRNLITVPIEDNAVDQNGGGFTYSQDSSNYGQFPNYTHPPPQSSYNQNHHQANVEGGYYNYESYRAAQSATNTYSRATVPASVCSNNYYRR